MKNSKGAGGLTELEGAALAVIAQDGPVTSYALKESFRVSPSDVWSGSTGAIYPLVRRLEGDGLIVSRAGRQGRRARRLLAVTPQGRKALHAWLADAERAARIGFDPLRTRLLFATLLPPARRRAFLERVRAALDAPVAAPVSAAPHVEFLHDAWVEARRQAFEKVAARLLKDEAAR